MKSLFALIAATCALATPVAAQNVVAPNLSAQRITPLHGLSQPTNMAILAPNDFLVNLKASGQVKRVMDGAIQTTPVLDLAVNSAQERGLLGMALHPDFANNNLVYIYYTAAASDGAPAIENRISRFTWNGSVLSGEQIIYTLPISTNNIHNGGILRFGPPNAAPADQKLFAVIGDTSREGQNQNFPGGPAPDNSGVVIRLNPDGSVPVGADKGPFYDVAAGNASLEVMYAYGIRNSFGIDFDPVTNALWDTENGFFDNDEINRIDPGFNSGWKTVMGYVSPEPTNLVKFGGLGTYSNPEFTWNKVIAPTAIHFYRGTTIGAEYQYDCFVGSTNSEKLYRFELNPTRTGFELTGDLADAVAIEGDDDSQITFGTYWGIITDIRTGPDGNLYVLSMTNGAIYKIRTGGNAAEQWSLYE